MSIFDRRGSRTVRAPARMRAHTCVVRVSRIMPLDETPVFFVHLYGKITLLDKMPKTPLGGLAGKVRGGVLRGTGYRAQTPP